jgi:hypothetical protein
MSGLNFARISRWRHTKTEIRRMTMFEYPLARDGEKFAVRSKNTIARREASNDSTAAAAISKGGQVATVLLPPLLPLSGKGG